MREKVVSAFHVVDLKRFYSYAAWLGQVGELSWALAVRESGEVRAERERIRALELTKERGSTRGRGFHWPGSGIRGDDGEIFCKAAGCRLVRSVEIVTDTVPEAEITPLREMVERVRVIDASRAGFQDRLAETVRCLAPPKEGDEDAREVQRWPGSEGRTIVEAADPEILRLAIKVYRK